MPQDVLSAQYSGPDGGTAAQFYAGKYQLRIKRLLRRLLKIDKDTIFAVCLPSGYENTGESKATFKV